MSNEWKEITADWQGGFAFIGKNPAGGSVQMGEIDNKTLEAMLKKYQSLELNSEYLDAV